MDAVGAAAPRDLRIRVHEQRGAAAPADLRRPSAKVQERRLPERLRAELDHVEALLDPGRESFQERTPVPVRLGGDEVAPGQTQCREHRYVRGREFGRVETPDVPPCDRLSFPAIRLAGVRLDAPHVEHDIAFRIAVLDPDERARGKYAHPEFFGQFAGESRLARFTRRELSARKLPPAGEVRPPRSLRNQHAARCVEQHPGDDMDSRAGHDSRVWRQAEPSAPACEALPQI